jgi:hypothetical protein
MQNTQHKRIPYSIDGDSHQIKNAPTKKHVKKMPPNFFFIQTFSLSFFPWTHSLTHTLPVTHCLKSYLSHLPLNILDDFIHFLMIYPLHTAEAFQHILCTHEEQQDAKVSVKIMSGKTKYLPTYTLHTSCEVRYLPHLLGEKLTHFLFFSSFSPNPSHHSIISAPINHNFLNSSNSTGKMIPKHTPWNERNEKNLWEPRLKG